MAGRTGEVLDEVETLIRNRPEGGNALVYRQRVRRLLESVAPNGSMTQMTTDGMVRIMGRQVLHPDELAARLVGAPDIATDEVQAASGIAGRRSRSTTSSASPTSTATSRIHHAQRPRRARRNGRGVRAGHDARRR